MDESPEVFDVIVVGAGVMGSSTAYQAAKRGKKTLLLEQFNFLHHRGSSHGESRTIRSTYPEDYYSAMVMESTKLWLEAEAEIGFKVYFKTSQFDLGPADDKSLQSVINSCKKNSIPYQILGPHEKEFCGKFRLPENWIGLVTEHGGVLKPTKAVSMFQSLALKNGAVLRDNMEVSEIKKDGTQDGILVVCENGNERFWGKKCVVTAGPWMKKLVKKVSGVELNIEPLETAVFYWKIKEGHQKEFTIENGFPSFASYGEPYVYGTPSLEFPELIKIAVHGGRLCDPDNRPFAFSSGAIDAVRQWVQGRFGGDLVDTSGPVMRQSCMYSMTPDEDFVIDYLGGEFGKDVVVAGGFSGHGFKMAPVVGRMLADIVCNEEANDEELKYFRIARFEKNPKGNVKEYSDQVNFEKLSI